MDAGHPNHIPHHVDILLNLVSGVPHRPKRQAREWLRLHGYWDRNGPTDKAQNSRRKAARP